MLLCLCVCVCVCVTRMDFGNAAGVTADSPIVLVQIILIHFALFLWCLRSGHNHDIWEHIKHTLFCPNWFIIHLDVAFIINNFCFYHFRFFLFWLLLEWRLLVYILFVCCVCFFFCNNFVDCVREYNALITLSKSLSFLLISQMNCFRCKSCTRTIHQIRQDVTVGFLFYYFMLGNVKIVSTYSVW